MFTITKIWLNSNKTKRGAYNQKQFDALSLNWPPEKGWQKQVCGKRISDANKFLFEECRHIQQSNKLLAAKKMASELTNLDLISLDQYIKHLRGR